VSFKLLIGSPQGGDLTFVTTSLQHCVLNKSKHWGQFLLLWCGAAYDTDK